MMLRSTNPTIAASLPFFLLLVFVFFSGQSQNKDGFLPAENLLDSLLRSYAGFSKILANEKEYDVQIIYTQINRNKDNTPVFRQFDYGLDPKKYFYAASLVKLPCSALALEKISELKVRKLNKYSTMETDSAWRCQKSVRRDTSSETGYPSVAHYIKKMMLVSDNDAYSRIYEFLGQEYINKKLAEKGYPNARIVHRFDGSCFGDDNSYTNPVSFYDIGRHRLIYQQPLQHNLIKYNNPIGVVKKGVGYVDGKANYVYQPKDFTYHNYLCLQDINDILKSIIFPDAVDEKQQFNVRGSDYSFLYKYMSMYPRESKYPKYGTEYKDSHKKYLIYGTYKERIAEDTIRIFNIVGQSYGYLSDCAYVCDFRNKTEFILSAVIYANKDGIMNDGKYDYETIGFPFLADLGKVIYNYERVRKKEFLPDLSEFKLQY